VVEIIEPQQYDAEDPERQEGDPSRIGQEIPIELRFHPSLVANMVDITDVNPQPQYGWTYDGDVFAAPVPYQPTADEILRNNTATRNSLLDTATRAINPLQDAVDLDDATPADVALLKAWKQYRVAVNRVVLTLAAPVWPTPPSA
jgi:hypothetical protein